MTSFSHLLSPLRRFSFHKIANVLKLAVIILLFLPACGQAEEEKILSSEQENFYLETVASELDHPWSVAFLPDDEYLVTERRGKMWRILPDGYKIEITSVPTVFHEGQGGLLDIILEPDFKDGGWIYFSYAAASEDGDDKANTEVARARLDLQENLLRDVEVIFKALPKVEGDNHWGSRLLLTPQGDLLITLGERFNFEDEAQNPANHLGALVRIKPDGSVPEDNPFVGQADKKPEIYSFGHRNPQGISLHPESGKIWIHEHGPKGGDEINILKAGANYGWPAVTFGVSYWGLKISDLTTAPGMEDPILQWTPSIAPSGMAFYTGDAFPKWKGDLFVGALAHKHLRRLELDGEKVVGEEELLKGRNERIRDVRQGPDGYLYILTDETDGKLLRLKPIS